jgi:hypothetical protein
MHPTDTARLERLTGSHATLSEILEISEMPGGLGLSEALPSTFGCMLGAAIAVADSRERAQNLRQHYLAWMPGLRLEQFNPQQQPQAALFHTPLQAERLPRLAGALDRAARVLHEQGLDPLACLGFADAQSALDGRTLAQVYDGCHFGRCMPLLYAYPGDLVAYQRELDAGCDLLSVIDRRLCAPLVHDLMHGPRTRAALFPAYFDECLSGYLGVAMLPSFAFPDPGQDNGILGAPWFSQVGLALVYGFGEGACWRAHVGAQTWEAALGAPLVSALERLGWGLYLAERGIHFLDGNTAPLPWVKLILLAAAGEEIGALSLDDLRRWPWSQIPARVSDGAPHPHKDLVRQAIEHALRSLYLRGTFGDGSPRVSCGVEGIGEVVLDPQQGTAHRAILGDRVDLAPPLHWLPPHLCAHLRAAGVGEVRLHLSELRALDEVVELLVGVAEGAATLRPCGGPGFVLSVC